jgi:hypothetical protein
MKNLVKYFKSLGFKRISTKNGSNYALLNYLVDNELDLSPIYIFVRITDTFLSIYERSKLGVVYQLHNYKFKDINDVINVSLKIYAFTSYCKEAEALRIKYFESAQTTGNVSVDPFNVKSS